MFDLNLDVEFLIFWNAIYIFKSCVKNITSSSSLNFKLFKKYFKKYNQCKLKVIIKINIQYYVWGYI